MSQDLQFGSLFATWNVEFPFLFVLFARGKADAAICVTLSQVSHQSTQNGIIQDCAEATVVCNCDLLFKNILDIFAKKFISSFLKESQHLRLSSIHPIPKTSNINL